jgi:RecB family exonuclease
VVDVVASYARGLESAPSVSLGERDLAALHRFRAGGGDPRHHPLAALVGRGFDLQAGRRSPDFTEWDGNLAGQPIPSATDRSLSPTRLQSWAHCGFRYYLAFVLGLGVRDDPERVVELNPLDRGSGVHKVLELFLGEVIAAGGIEPDEPWSDVQRARMHAIAAAVFEELEARGRTGRPLLWQLGRAELHTMLDELLDADEQYRTDRRARPERVELPFGVADAPPVVLEMAGGRTLEFRGFADRVDRVGADHLVVSDYKTGRGSGYARIHESDPVQGGTLLQLGLYAEAAHQLLGAASTEAYYWVVDPRASYARFGYPWTDDRRARFVDVLTTIVEGIEAGVFLVEPGEWNTWRNTHDECMYCEFDGLCVRDRGEQHEAKVDAPALRRRDGLAWAEDA